MKKISIILLVLVLFALNACEECEVCEECTDCPCENTDEKFPEGSYVLLQNKIFILNVQNSSLSKVIDINNVTEGLELYQLTFDTENQKFYTIVNNSSNPQLAEISTSGDFKIIGSFSYNSQPIAMVEGIEYNPIDKNVYASASLNGGLDQNDFWSESLIIVNPSNANCTYINEVETNVPTPETDIDNMAFNEKGILYTLDAAPPGANYTNIFQFPYMSSAQLAFQTSFLPFSKILFSDDDLYLISERELYKVDLIDKSTFESIGTTHQETEYNGEIIAGVTNIKYQLNY